MFCLPFLLQLCFVFLVKMIFHNNLQIVFLISVLNYWAICHILYSLFSCSKPNYFASFCTTKRLYHLLCYSFKQWKSNLVYIIQPYLLHLLILFSSAILNIVTLLPCFSWTDLGTREQQNPTVRLPFLCFISTIRKDVSLLIIFYFYFSFYFFLIFSEVTIYTLMCTISLWVQILANMICISECRFYFICCDNTLIAGLICRALN